MSEKVFSKKDLYTTGPQKSYPGDAREVAFLLGGIGTGNISVGARGELRDWEIFNKPAKGQKLPYSFFSIYMKEEGRQPIARVLEAKCTPPFSESHGHNPGGVNGLPRFEKSSLRGEYPFVTVDLVDDKLPVRVTLEAFTPFIPLNPEDSGIPCAILRYRVKNVSSSPTDVTVAGSLLNAVGYCGLDSYGNIKTDYFTGNINEFRQTGNLSGLFMYSDAFEGDDPRFGSMCILTTDSNVTVKRYNLEGGWWDGIQDYWDDFCEDGLLSDNTEVTRIDQRGRKVRMARFGAVGVPRRLEPSEEKEFTFILTWYFPNRIKGWKQECDCSSGCCTETVRNHYALLFKDAWDVGRYVADNLPRLESESRKFRDAFFSSTLPDYVLSAVSSNITVLRSTTCFWLENGTFLGWEGCFDKEGCCDGTCTHVWNYAQTLAFLFPSLERSMRVNEFLNETDETGKMAFRSHTVFDRPRWNFHPAADGQMGSIIRLYREWKLSGDNEFLKKLWNRAKKAMDFAFTYWDSDGDYVLDSQQHNTYDIEFYGPNSLVNSMFFGALKAMAEMARAMGDDESASKYLEAWEKGSAKMDELLWGGEYYVQKIDDVNKYKYQYGTGCLSDQLLGQFLSHVVGLGYILPEEHVKKAVESIFRYNFMTSFDEHHNVQRVYAINDEKGLLLCSWPHGGRPKLPFVYCDEVWTGIEYQVAAHLIYEGFVDEGLTIVKSVRDRHNGYKRNPWNEVECGHHYARSMASWGVLTALTGFRCDLVNKKLYFSPKLNTDNFTAFWSCGTAWGTFEQKRSSDGEFECTVNVLYGNLDGVEVFVENRGKTSKACINACCSEK